MERLGDFVRCEDSAQRQSTGERLRNGDDVGSDAVVLVSEVAPGAPAAALNLIENQQRTAVRSHFARGGEKFLRNRNDAAFALYSLQANRDDRIVELLLEVLDLVELHEGHTGQQRRIRIAILLLTGCRESAVGA